MGGALERFGGGGGSAMYLHTDHHDVKEVRMILEEPCLTTRLSTWANATSDFRM